MQKKKITEFKDIAIETIQNKHTKQKDQRKNEWDHSNIWDNIKPYNIRVIEVLNQEMERKRQKKKYLKKNGWTYTTIDFKN